MLLALSTMSPLVIKIFNTALNCSAGYVLGPIQQCSSDIIPRLGAQSSLDDNEYTGGLGSWQCTYYCCCFATVWYKVHKGV